MNVLIPRDALRRHPLALLRAQLAKWWIRTAEDLRRNGQTVRASGIVTHRRQPSMGSGVIFATLEDETGTVNIIVWPCVAEAQRAALRGSMLLSVKGTWPSEKECPRSSRCSSWTTPHCLAACVYRAGISDEAATRPYGAKQENRRYENVRAERRAP